MKVINTLTMLFNIATTTDKFMGKEILSKKEFGLEIFSIIRDGYLNGIYTYNGQLYNEIASKKDSEKKEICGKYSSVYYEENQIKITGKLIIKQLNKNENDNEFSFEWIGNKKRHYFGYGNAINSSQIVVFYWQ